MIDFNNKGFFKLKQNDEYAERVSSHFSSLGKVRFEFTGKASVVEISRHISRHLL